MNPNQSAFPAADDYTAQGKRVYGPKNCEGMSLRDYFAAKALQGWLAHGEVSISTWTMDYKEVARFCYIMADAMLVQRQEK